MARNERYYKTCAFALTFMAYTFFHMSRKPWSIVKDTLHPHDDTRATPGWFPFSESDGKVLLGALDTVFLGTYAAGLYASGMIGDRVNLKHFLVIGMCGSGVMVASFGMSFYWNIHWFPYFVIVNAICGLFQSIGWPTVVAIMGHWFGHESRGSVMGFWNAHTSVGNILGSLVATAALDLSWNDESWQYSFLVPGGIIFVGGLIVAVFLVATPEEVGLVSKAKESSDDPLLGSPEAEWKKVPDDRGISFVEALSIPGVVEYALSLFFAKLVAYSFLYWLPYYLGHIGYSSTVSGYLSIAFDTGGMFGGAAAGSISDRLRKRAIVAVGFLVLSAPALWGFRLITDAVGKNHMWASILAMGVCGALVNAPYALITTAVSVDLGSHKCLKGRKSAMSTVTGIIDGTGSIGAAIQGITIGLISSNWNVVFIALAGCCAMAAVLLIRPIYREHKGLDK